MEHNNRTTKSTGFVSLAAARRIIGCDLAEISSLTYRGALPLHHIKGALYVAKHDAEAVRHQRQTLVASGAECDTDRERQGTVLRPIADPSPAMAKLADELYLRIRKQQPSKRQPKAEDETRFKASLLAFLYVVGRNALMRIPPHHGANLSFSEARYIGSGISPTALRVIREALSEMGLIVRGRHLNHPSDPAKSFATRIRHTSALSDLLREHGVSLSDFVDPPLEVIAVSDPIDTEVAIPADIRASEGVLRRYNEFVRSHSFTLPETAWQDLLDRVIDADRTGKTDKLHGGYDDHRIYLTRRFAGSWERGGRLYDAYYQSLPKDLRAELMIDGEPTIELDFSRLHPRMLFNELGLKLDRDPYAVDGFDVPLEAAKQMFNRLLNGKRSVTYQDYDEIHFPNESDFYKYKKALIGHLGPISHLFQKEHGVRLQKRDSDLALIVLERCMDECVPVYPVHDSFIVKKLHEDTLRNIMCEEYEKMMGFSCVVR